MLGPLWLFLMLQAATATSEGTVSPTETDPTTTTTGKTTPSSTTSLPTTTPPRVAKLTPDENHELQTSCGQRTFGADPANVTASRAPWLITMHHNDKKWTPAMSREDTLKHSSLYCTGLIISKRHVILPARCFDKAMNLRRTTFVTEKLLKTSMGLIITMGKIEMEVNKVYAAALYRYKTTKAGWTYGDLAVVELKTDFEFSETLQPICLADYVVQQNQQATLQTAGNKNLTTKVIDCKDEGKPYDHLCTAKDCAAYKEKETYVVDYITQVHYKKETLVALTHTKEDCRADPVYDPAAGPTKDLNIAVVSHIHWICAHTGICPNEKVRAISNAAGAGYLLRAHLPDDRIFA